MFRTSSCQHVEPPGAKSTPVTSAVTEVALRLREDLVTEANQRELNQRSAPAVADGLFLVPKVIE